MHLPIVHFKIDSNNTMQTHKWLFRDMCFTKTTSNIGGNQRAFCIEWERRGKNSSLSPRLHLASAGKEAEQPGRTGGVGRRQSRPDSHDDTSKGGRAANP
jgi:hypothetical protein